MDSTPRLEFEQIGPFINKEVTINIDAIGNKYHISLSNGIEWETFELPHDNFEPHSDKLLGADKSAYISTRGRWSIATMNAIMASTDQGNTWDFLNDSEIYDVLNGGIHLPPFIGIHKFEHYGGGTQSTFVVTTENDEVYVVSWKLVDTGVWCYGCPLSGFTDRNNLLEADEVLLSIYPKGTYETYICTNKRALTAQYYDYENGHISVGASGFSHDIDMVKQLPYISDGGDITPTFLNSKGDHYTCVWNASKHEWYNQLINKAEDGVLPLAFNNYMYGYSFVDGNYLIKCVNNGDDTWSITGGTHPVNPPRTYIINHPSSAPVPRLFGTQYNKGAIGVNWADDTYLIYDGVISKLGDANYPTSFFERQYIRQTGDTKMVFNQTSKYFSVSENGGSCWTIKSMPWALTEKVQFFQFQNDKAVYLGVNPTSDGKHRLLAADKTAVFLSDDNGDSWTIIDNWMATNVRDHSVVNLKSITSSGASGHAVHCDGDLVVVTFYAFDYVRNMVAWTLDKGTTWYCIPYWTIKNEPREWSLSSIDPKREFSGDIYGAVCQNHGDDNYIVIALSSEAVKLTFNDGFDKMPDVVISSRGTSWANLSASIAVDPISKNLIAAGHGAAPEFNVFDPNTLEPIAKNRKVGGYWEGYMDDYSFTVGTNGWTNNCQWYFEDNVMCFGRASDPEDWLNYDKGDKTIARKIEVIKWNLVTDEVVSVGTYNAPQDLYTRSFRRGNCGFISQQGGNVTIVHDNVVYTIKDGGDLVSAPSVGISCGSVEPPVPPPVIIPDDNWWLVRHAAANVWCDPNNDNRLTARLGRISEVEGETYGMQVTDYSILLPTNDRWYHVYQLGNLSAEYVGIKQLWDVWTRLDRVVNEYGLNLKIYSEDGRTFPLSLAWIRQLPNDNVIIALGDYEEQIELKTTPMFISFYDGAYRHTADYDGDKCAEVYGELIRNQMGLENLYRKYQTWKEKPGEVQAYVNGHAVFDLNSNCSKVWDYIEIYRDSLVKETHLFPVKDLPTFTSALDEARKYLLHPLKDDSSIEFVNDVDIFVFDGLNGCYYPIHKAQSVRQLTHCDYSIPAHYVAELQNANGWTSLDNLTIKVNVRYSGINRHLIYEHTQLREMYKMDDKCILNSMVGLNSTIEEWQASNLENSHYCRLMAARYHNITKDYCTDTYGYDAVTKYVSDTPVLIGDGVFKLPPLLEGYVTVYEYTADGKYLGKSEIVHQYKNAIYRPVNAGCAMIEPLIGRAGDTASVTYDAINFTTKKGVNYRFFKNRKKNGEVPYIEFEDITGTDAYSIDADGVVVWNLDLQTWRPVVASDEVILDYTHVGNLVDGVIDFSVHSDPSGSAHLVPYHPKVLDLAIGEYQLIPEVDYHVEWPRIVIYTKQRLGLEDKFATIPIQVRAIGLSDSYVSPQPGYVVDGILSNNNRFDLRDGKVTRIIVDGKVRHHSEVVFREDRTIGMDGLVNGMPYVINDTMIPLRTIVSDERSIYELKVWDAEFASRVEDYLSIFIPQGPTIVHNPIHDRYKTFSPILNKVIHDLKNGLLTPVEDDQLNYISTEQFDNIMQPYIGLLTFDPVRLHVNDNYVVVEPHAYAGNIELSPLQYSLIERINDRYLGNKIILNKLLSVKG